jgi:hypothetical protein
VVICFVFPHTLVREIVFCTSIELRCSGACWGAWTGSGDEKGGLTTTNALHDSPRHACQRSTIRQELEMGRRTDAGFRYRSQWHDERRLVMGVEGTEPRPELSATATATTERGRVARWRRRTPRKTKELGWMGGWVGWALKESEPTFVTTYRLERQRSCYFLMMMYLRNERRGRVAWHLFSNADRWKRRRREQGASKRPGA